MQKLLARQSTQGQNPIQEPMQQSLRKLTIAGLAGLLFCQCSFLPPPFGEEETEDQNELLLLLGLAGVQSNSTASYVAVTSLAGSGATGFVYFYQKASSGCGLTELQQITVGHDPYDLAIDSSGGFVYIANAADSNITRLQFDASSRQLINAATYTQNGAASTTPYGMAIHPSGFLYAADGSSTGSVGTFQKDSNGALSNIGTGYTSAAAYIWFTALDLNNQYLFATNFNGFADAGNDTIRSYSINQSTGALSFLNTYATQDKPWYVLRHPDLNTLYTTNYGSASVSMYTINSDGSLSTLGGGTVATGTNPIGISMNSNFAFVAPSGSSQINGYTVNASSGELASLATTSTDATPYGLKLTNDGSCLYVARPAAGSVAIYNVSSTGSLSLETTISAGPGPRFIDILQQ